MHEKSPDVQPWLYAEWVEMPRARPTDKGEVPSFQMEKIFSALTWQESMGAMLLYNEEDRSDPASLAVAGSGEVIRNSFGSEIKSTSIFPSPPPAAKPGSR